MHWLNGGPAKPTTTPPRPFERGVGGRPTLIQNVETLAHLALIARFGANWFRGVGTADDPGSLLVSVSGAVARPAVLEVPLGVPIGRIVAAFGLEVEPQAALVGGYFGAWLPWREAVDLPLTRAHLRAAGGSIGAGIVAVLPPESCGLCETTRIAAYLATQSARQCGPCQHGLPAIARDLAQLCHGSDPAARERAVRRMRRGGGPRRLPASGRRRQTRPQRAAHVLRACRLARAPRRVRRDAPDAAAARTIALDQRGAVAMKAQLRARPDRVRGPRPLCGAACPSASRWTSGATRSSTPSR